MTDVLKDLSILFEAVDNGDITPTKAIDIFWRHHNGDHIYIPKVKITKRDKILKALRRGLAKSVIKEQYDVSTAYIYKVAKG